MVIVAGSSLPELPSLARRAFWSSGVLLSLLFFNAFLAAVPWGGAVPHLGNGACARVACVAATNGRLQSALEELWFQVDSICEAPHDYEIRTQVVTKEHKLYVRAPPHLPLFIHLLPRPLRGGGTSFLGVTRRMLPPGHSSEIRKLPFAHQFLGLG